jgi:glutamate synthase (NADPH/NADH) large chain
MKANLTSGLPAAQGLYDPRFEHDACGIGVVAHIKGVKSHQIVRDGLTVLKNLDHRGARGSDPDTGDGAGILLQIPHAFFMKAARQSGFELPEPGNYGVGMVFLPRDASLRADFERRFAAFVAAEGEILLGWRDVPVNNAGLGRAARETQPFVRQVFIRKSTLLLDEMAFERLLYIIRKRAERAIRYGLPGGSTFYIASLSSRTIVYKGMLTPEQLVSFYPELSDPDLESAIALVHSRFSTNTFPSWERAHPNRYLIHNGEINTLRGNVNWMHARESILNSPAFGADLAKVVPIVNDDGSDSAIFDETLEFLHMAGRSLPHAMMMMIPEPWSKHETMDPVKKAFYEYHACLMEPWDGPAAMAFSDGHLVGAALDRNGLRPARYYITTDDRIILASEVGVLDLPADRIIERGRLQPGRMLLIDTLEGRIVDDTELKASLAAERPYREWLDQYLLSLDELPEMEPAAPEKTTLLERQQAFGYSHEDLRLILTPMAQDAVEPIGAMGTDIPLAVLSEKPQLLYNYFKQLFAQVTNPPIDAIREEIVTGSETFLGSEGNILTPEPESCRQIKLERPILSDTELAKLARIKVPGFKTITLPTLYPVNEDGEGLRSSLENLFSAGEAAIRGGANILVLSDRGVNREMAAIPSLLALSGLHHYLIRKKLRTQVSLVMESAEPREVHHFALLIGYGAAAVNPYLAFESLKDLIERQMIKNIDYPQAVKNYIKAGVKGIVKILSKMGISTIQSYQGAQIFEAVGIGPDVIKKYFSGTSSRIGGIGLGEISREVELRHELTFQTSAPKTGLASGGVYQWRSGGEDHLYNPESIYLLQQACRSGDYQQYKKFASLINHPEQGRAYTLRNLLELKQDFLPIPLDEVEAVESICRRFKTGAMSYGSISLEAHECLAIAMNRIGGKSNTGEGGEDPRRFVPLPNGDSKCSAIKQVASGRFGVTSEYLVNAEELQIKMAQGAKPGEGGQLPGRKVYPWIAKVRHSTPGVGLISPPPHHDIYSIEDLAELIHDLKNANRQARISVKLVSEVGVGTIAAGVAKGRADVILISGYDGGTGASPRTSIRHAGLPWELGLAETHQTLVLNDLRSRVVLETDGKLMTGRDVAIAALLGAEEFGFATLPLVAIGCVMMRICNLDTCPVGVATQNPKLRKKFCGDPQYVVNLMRFIAMELREIMAELGFRTIDEMVGRTDLLQMQPDIKHWKAWTLDLSSLLYQPEVGPEVGRYHQTSQNHHLEDSLDERVLLDACRPALEKRRKVQLELAIRNTDRVVGAILGSEVTRRYGSKGLPDDTIQIGLAGSAGQSFGAFLPPGITLRLEGDSNDYIGKGLSGGRIVVVPPQQAPPEAATGIIIGNVAFYGATSGEAFIRGRAGERFAVRNSGANTVVEGVGDHGCEYMTGGRVIVLGPTGRNFAAGMSGGIAYVLDETGDFAANCNKEMTGLEPLADKAEIQEVKKLLEKHLSYTNSEKAARILADWPKQQQHFIRVIPHDYERALQEMSKLENGGLSSDELVMAAFEANRGDLKRVSGN